jgi:hypothetical protein
MRKTTYVREIRDAYKIFIGNCDRKSHLGDLHADGRTILKTTIDISHLKVWTGFIWLKRGNSSGILPPW